MAKKRTTKAPKPRRNASPGKPPKESATMADQLRQAIDESGFSRYRIAQETGINEAALGKFYHGTRGMTQANLERLFAFLGLRITKGD